MKRKTRDIFYSFADWRHFVSVTTPISNASRDSSLGFQSGALSVANYPGRLLVREEKAVRDNIHHRHDSASP